jgi:hypothetical protein
VEWNERFKTHHTWLGAWTADFMQLLRLCGNALWKIEIKEIKQRFFMACQLFYSKGHFNCYERFD